MTYTQGQRTIVQERGLLDTDDDETMTLKTPSTTCHSFTSRRLETLNTQLRISMYVTRKYKKKSTVGLPCGEVVHNKWQHKKNSSLH